MNAEQMIRDSLLDDPITFRTGNKREVKEVIDAVERLRDQNFKVSMERTTYGYIVTVEEKPISSLA